MHQLWLNIVSNYDFSKYLDDNNSLNTGKLWSDVAAISGFYRTKRREDLYNAVTTWYYEHIKSEKEKSNATT